MHCSTIQVVSQLYDKQLEPFHQPASEEEAIYSQLSLHNPAIHIPADQIQYAIDLLRQWSCSISVYLQHRVKGHLGSGHFATVKRGKWMSCDGEKEVAIKTLHRDAGNENRVKCLQEAAIMAQFHHPNIVLLHGIVIDEDRNVRKYIAW